MSRPEGRTGGIAEKVKWIRNYRARKRGEEQLAAFQPILNTLARGTSYEFKPGNEFAIDTSLTPPVATFDMNFYTGRHGYTPEQGLFALFHEIRSHLVEKDKMLESTEGRAVHEERKQREDEVPWLHIWENCRTDAAGNRSILSEVAPVLSPHAEDLYRYRLFADRDFRKLPKHLQFMYAALVEKMLPDATDIQVSPEVSEAMDKLRATTFTAPDGQTHQDVLEYVTQPDRLYDPGQLAVWRYQASKQLVEPEIEKLHQQDLQDPNPDWQKSKNKGKQPDKADNNSPFSGEYGDYESRIHPHTWDDKDTDPKPQPEPDPEPESEPEAHNVNDPDAKDKTSEKQSGREKFKSTHGLSEDEMRLMESYDEIYRAVNPYIEQLRQVFLSVLAHRQVYVPNTIHNQPRGRSTGRSLRNQFIATQGSDRELATRPAKMNISGLRTNEQILPIGATWHLVLDQSVSMKKGRKLRMQAESTVLFLETLAQFEAEAARLGVQFEIESELRAFGAKTQTQTALYKEITDDLSMKKRAEIFRNSSYTFGGTNDFDSLQEVISQIVLRRSIDRKYREDLQSGARKEFVIVFTDGESNNPDLLAKKLHNLVGKGVKVVAVGMTSSGEAVVQTYDIGNKERCEGIVCEDISKLPSVVARILETDIKSLDIL